MIQGPRRRIVIVSQGVAYLTAQTQLFLASPNFSVRPDGACWRWRKDSPGELSRNLVGDGRSGWEFSAEIDTQIDLDAARCLPGNLASLPFARLLRRQRRPEIGLLGLQKLFDPNSF